MDAEPIVSPGTPRHRLLSEDERTLLTEVRLLFGGVAGIDPWLEGFLAEAAHALGEETPRTAHPVAKN